MTKRYKKDERKVLMDLHLKKLQRQRTRQATAGLLFVIGGLLLLIVLLYLNRG